MMEPDFKAVTGLTRLVCGLWVSRAIWAAARLRIADAIDDEPVPLAQIAARARCREDKLRRLLDTLAAHGVFARAGRDSFAHTPLSRVLRTDDPASQCAFVESIFGLEHYQAWSRIDECLREEGTGFELHYGSGLFDFHKDNPVNGRLFAEALRGSTQRMEDAILSAHVFRPFSLAVDVGGGHGSLLHRLLQRHPGGRGILFERPEVADAAAKTLAARRGERRFEILAGDFLDAVPARGDLYLLKLVLHDWPDRQCVTILRNVRRAMAPGARLAVIEVLLPSEPVPHFSWLLDLNMMMITGGRERRADQYRDLLAEAGFRLVRSTPTQSVLSVIEAAPA